LDAGGFWVQEGFNRNFDLSSRMDRALSKWQVIVLESLNEWFWILDFMFLDSCLSCFSFWSF
jgi:hypothetical protein